MPAMELAAGVILDGHYRLRQLLGRGGMGEVWEAEHTRLPKLFAIKFLSGLSKAEPELLMRFKREAEIASRLAHPSIVQVTDFNTLPDGTAYIAMERLVGEDLRARLGRGPLDLPEVREITRQVASALALTHREGVVHRDLKPENIFLCREADGSLRAKVLDFGISKLQGLEGHGTRDDRVLGTPGYMAPEQAMGKNSAIDGRTDLFSLASIVYEMLTGQGVFVGDTLAELCTKVLYHTPPPLDQVLPAVPRPIAVAVSMALSKDPNMRQSEIGLFADAVVGAGAGGTSGFSATVASDVSPVPSIAARAARSGAREEPSASTTRDLLQVDAADAITRSRRPAAAASSQPVRGARERSIVISIAVVAALVAGAVSLELHKERTTSAALEPPPVPSEREPAPRPTGADEPEVRAVATDTTESVHDASLQGADVRVPEVRAAADPGALSKRKPDALSTDASAVLDEAEAALSHGDSAGALRLARGSLRDGNSERAYLLMARAYCKQRDVGMVQAMLRNLSAAGKKAAKRECQLVGLTVP